MPTGIEWTDKTWNPVTGCAKVSQGCKHCYAEREWPRMARLVPSYAGRAFTDVACHENRLDQPLHWKRPRKVFVNSMSDLFHPDVPDEFLDRVFAVMALAPQHVFQVLTKRPARMREYLARPAVEVRIGLEAMAMCLDSVAATKGKSKLGAGILLNASDINPGGLATWPLPNVWLGVSVEDQDAADERIPLLLETPAAVRWISAEPLLGPVNLTAITPEYPERFDALAGRLYCDEPHVAGSYEDTPRLDWVVVGGESGPNARPMHPKWAKSLRDQCTEAGVPFLFKQWGEWVPRSACYHIFEDGKSCADYDPDATRWPCIRLTEHGHNGRDLAHAGEGCDAYMQRIGKKAAGRLLAGATHDGYPDNRVRESEQSLTLGK